MNAHVPDANEAFVSLAQMLQGIVGGMQANQFGLESYEYDMVPVGELTERGRDRWRVVPVPPAQQIKVTLGQPQPGDLMFLMERKVPERVLDEDGHCVCGLNEGQPHPTHGPGGF